METKLKSKNIEEFDRPPNPTHAVKCNHWLAWEKDDQDEHFGWRMKLVFKETIPDDKEPLVVVVIGFFCDECAQKEVERHGENIVAQMPHGMLTTEGLRKWLLNNENEGLRIEAATPRGKRQMRAALPKTATIQ